MLCLRRHQVVARHFPSAIHDRIVVRVKDADSESMEPHVFGKTVNNVHEVTVAFDLRNANELGALENHGGVNLFAGKVDVLFVYEPHNALQCVSIHGSSQRIGWICYEQSLDSEAIFFSLSYAASKPFLVLKQIRPDVCNRYNGRIAPEVNTALQEFVHSKTGVNLVVLLLSQLKQHSKERSVSKQMIVLDISK
ncbi:hypothetical protein F3Y22_tig00110384pilonHSYRG00527 [Hibiscus syriacus]|uniref:Uncharacterized protein n=1 Tax=Hibiscus syriacus TaxID=106335 RepID=A0A6A3AW86_HIBSY|nr:hypothetical protein F3Y22_tig00110384pilonHSYRG00527 [Hibiscus syriacus]